MHNEVNARLAGIEEQYGHSASGDPDYPKLQWPTEQQCPTCRYPGFPPTQPHSKPPPQAGDAAGGAATGKRALQDAGSTASTAADTVADSGAASTTETLSAVSVGRDLNSVEQAAGDGLMKISTTALDQALAPSMAAATPSPALSPALALPRIPWNDDEIFKFLERMFAAAPPTADVNIWHVNATAAALDPDLNQQDGPAILGRRGGVIDPAAATHAGSGARSTSSVIWPIAVVLMVAGVAIGFVVLRTNKRRSQGGGNAGGASSYAKALGSSVSVGGSTIPASASHGGLHTRLVYTSSTSGGGTGGGYGTAASSGGVGLGAAVSRRRDPTMASDHHRSTKGGLIDSNDTYYDRSGGGNGMLSKRVSARSSASSSASQGGLRPTSSGNSPRNRTDYA